jgi:hypothetical protein
MDASMRLQMQKGKFFCAEESRNHRSTRHFFRLMRQVMPGGVVICLMRPASTDFS